MTMASGSERPADVNRPTGGDQLAGAIVDNRNGGAPDAQGGSKLRPTYERFFGINEPPPDPFEDPERYARIIDERQKGIS